MKKIIIGPLILSGMLLVSASATASKVTYDTRLEQDQNQVSELFSDRGDVLDKLKASDAEDSSDSKQHTILHSSISVGTLIGDRFVRVGTNGQMQCAASTVGIVRYNYSKTQYERCTPTGWEVADDFGGDGGSCVVANLKTHEYYPRSGNHYYYDWKEVMMSPDAKKVKRFSAPGDNLTYKSQIGKENFTRGLSDLTIGATKEYPHGYSKKWSTSYSAYENCHGSGDGYYSCQNYGKTTHTTVHEAYCDSGTWHYFKNGIELNPLN